MTTDDRVFQEMEASWRALTLLFGLMEAGRSEPREVSELLTLVQRLAERLGRQTDARLCRVFMLHNEEQISAAWPEGTSGLSDVTLATAGEVLQADLLRMPLFTGGQINGFLEVVKGPEDEPFGTRDKKLLSAIVAYLSLLGDRDILYRTSQRLHTEKTEFLSHVEASYRTEAALCHILKETQKVDAPFLDVCDAVLPVVARGLSSSASALAVWDVAGTLVHHAKNGVDREALAKLGDIVRQRGPAICSDPESTVFAFRRTKELSEAYPMRAVMIAPLRRLPSGSGVIAVARTAEQQDFTTSEKHALELVGALLSGSLQQTIPVRVASN